MAHPSIRDSAEEVNEYDYCVCIPLTRGKHTIIDAEDYPKVIHRRWQCSPDGYARYTNHAEGGMVAMHRLLMNAPCDLKVDHINGDSLDNRKVNLRICNDAQSAQNRGPQKKRSANASRYKGVYWAQSPRKWMAIIATNSNRMYLGVYETEDEAAMAYNRAALVAHGPFARLNVIP